MSADQIVIPESFAPSARMSVTAVFNANLHFFAPAVVPTIESAIQIVEKASMPVAERLAHLPPEGWLAAIGIAILFLVPMGRLAVRR